MEQREVTSIPELEITKLIHLRLNREDYLDKSNRETIAYRIAEIMTVADTMVTRSLPLLTNVKGESTFTVEDDLEGMRRTFLHLRDLLYDFDNVFLESIPRDSLADTGSLFITEEEVRAEFEDSQDFEVDV